MKYKIQALILICLFYCFQSPAEGKEMASEEKIVLPQPDTKGSMSLEQSIAKRRSVRNFSSKNLDIEQVSQILWATQGVTEEYRGFRAAPSAGALYPLEIYIVYNDAAYHYNSKNHSLEKVTGQGVKSKLLEAAWGQLSIDRAPVSVVICAVMRRTTSKYGRRGERYVYMDAGHAAENLHLQAVALGLASVPIGAFTDSEVQKALGLSRDIEPIYIIPVGYEKKGL